MLTWKQIGQQIKNMSQNDLEQPALFKVDNELVGVEIGIGFSTLDNIPHLDLSPDNQVTYLIDDQHDNWKEMENHLYGEECDFCQQYGSGACYAMGGEGC